MQGNLRRIARSSSPTPASPILRKTLEICSTSSSSGKPSITGPPVAVFWDLNSKPPNSTSIYDAAVRLRLAASSIGPLRFVSAYSTPHIFISTPSSSRSSPLMHSISDTHICRFCGRKFYAHSKLLNHFQIHEREHAKRLSRIDSATGGRYVRMKARLDQKMEKYRKAARDIFIPMAGHGFGDELRRAGVSVRIVEDREGASDGALRNHMAETMERRRIGCLILVSCDAGFAEVIREAKARRMKTVVVGDDGDGALKRWADSSFSWKEVISGKARKEGASAVVKWNDKDLVKRLEWRYRSDVEEKEKGIGGSGCEDAADSGNERASDRHEDLMGGKAFKQW